MFSRKSVTVYSSKDNDLMAGYPVKHPLLEAAELIGTLAGFACLAYLAFRILFF